MTSRNEIQNTNPNNDSRKQDIENSVADYDGNEYWKKRRKNNEAARRSREKRRLNDMMMEKRVMQLTEENKKLKTQLWTIKIKYGEVPDEDDCKISHEVFQPDIDNPHSKIDDFKSRVFTNSCGDTSAKVIIKSAGSRSNSSKDQDSIYKNSLLIPSTSPSPSEVVSRSNFAPYPSLNNNDFIKHLQAGNMSYSQLDYQALMNGIMRSDSVFPPFVSNISNVFPLDLRQHRKDSIEQSSESKIAMKEVTHERYKLQQQQQLQRFYSSGSIGSTTSPGTSPFYNYDENSQMMYVSSIHKNLANDECQLPLKLRLKRKAVEAQP